MFAKTNEIAEKNMKIIKELGAQADLQKPPDLDSLPSINMDKTTFLEKWNEIGENFSWTFANITASLIGASILSKLDFSFEKIKKLANKLNENAPEGRTFEYFMEEFDQKFSENEKELLQLPGKVCSIEEGSTLQKIYHKSFTSFSMIREASYILSNYTAFEIDSTYHNKFDIIRGGDGREVYQWLVNDYQKNGKPQRHFYGNRHLIIGGIIRGSGVYVREKVTKNLLGFVKFSYGDVSNLSPPYVEIDVIQTLEEYRRQGIAKLMQQYIQSKLYPKISVITGSPIDESVETYRNWSLCQFNETGRPLRTFTATRPYVRPTKKRPNGFSITLDEDQEYYSVTPSIVKNKNDFTLFKFKDGQSLRNIYYLESPIVVAYDKRRNYRKKPTKITLMHDGKKLVEKLFWDTYDDDAHNDEKVIYINETCILIEYLYGEFALKIDKVLSERNDSVKRLKLSKDD